MAGRTELGLPRQPIGRLTRPVARFLPVEAASGLVLVAATATALLLANSPTGDAFVALWTLEVRVGVGDFQMAHSLRHWINDGLMAVFFFVVGLEVKREVALGELRDPRRAAFPLAAALGGMVVPAAVYLALQPGGEAVRGWGIPMATDIAFVVGCLALLGRRAPAGLRVLLLSLAVIDDLGAILVIAVGYTESIQLAALGLGVLGIAAVALLARLGVRSFGVYGLLGLGVWLGFHESGVHATVAGVVLGMMTPARPYLEGTGVARLLDRTGEILHGDPPESHRAEEIRRLRWATRETISPLEYLEGLLHPWVAFVVMPLFALANAGVRFSPADFADPLALAVAAGLVVGKPLGVLVVGGAAVALGVARLPSGLRWAHVAAGGALAGIGFTMSLFIAGLALSGPALEAAKVGILGASLLAAALGLGGLLALHARHSREA